MAWPMTREVSRRPGFNGGRIYGIVLPDDRRLELRIGPDLLGSELVEMAASHCNIFRKGQDLFGLAYRDPVADYDCLHWVYTEKKVADQDIPLGDDGIPILFLMTKLFMDSISDLQDPVVTEICYALATREVVKGSIRVRAETAYQLAGCALQANHGDFVGGEVSRRQLRQLKVLPQSIVDTIDTELRESHVVEQHQRMIGLTRQEAVLNYMTILEAEPSYGIHYYRVLDKRRTPCWLGISGRGILHYELNDKESPVEVYAWKRLENLYFRDRKFTIEIHGSRRDPTTRKVLGGNGVTALVFYGENQPTTKSIWSMAIAQHKFYLDRKQPKIPVLARRESGWSLPVPPDLSKSCTSLSATASASSSSVSNLSRCGSTRSLSICSLHNSVESIQSDGSCQAKVEMLVAALRARKEAMEAKLLEKKDELRRICLREGELTGSLPPEYPLGPGEQPPVVRRRVGTAFAFPAELLWKLKSKDEDALELELEIQKRIASAALKLANDMNAKKSVRKTRRHSYQLAKLKLQELEQKIQSVKTGKPLESSVSAGTLPTSYWTLKMKKPRHLLLGGKSESSPALSGLRKKRSKPDLSVAIATTEWKDPKADIVELSNMPHSPRIYRPRSHSQSDLDEGVGVPKAEVRSRTPPPKSPRDGADEAEQTDGLVLDDLAMLGTRRRQPNPVIPPNCLYNQRPIPRRSQQPIQRQATFNSHLNYEDDHLRRNGGPEIDLLDSADTTSGLYNIPRQRTSLAHHCIDYLDQPSDSGSNLDVRQPSTSKLESRSVDGLDSINDEDPDDEASRRALRNASLGFCGTDVIDGSQLYPPMAMFRSTSASLASAPRPDNHLMNVTADVLPSSSSYYAMTSKNAARTPMHRSQSASVNDGGRRANSGNVGPLPNRLIDGMESLMIGHSQATRAHPPSSSAGFQPPTAASSRVVFSRTLPRYSTCSKVVRSGPVVQNAADVVKPVPRERRWYETSLDAPPPPPKTRDPAEDLDFVEDMSRVHAVPFNSEQVDEPSHVPCEFPMNQTAISAGQWHPVKVTTKRFEMADYYKYSTKYRKQLSPCPSDVKPSASGPASPSPSARSDSSVSLHQQHSAHYHHQHQPYLHPKPQLVHPCPQSPQLSPAVLSQRSGVASPNTSFNFDMPESQAEAFQQEMFAWVNQNKKPQSRSATLV